MRRVLYILTILLFTSGCSSEIDRQNNLLGRIEKMNNKISIGESVYTFDSKEFHEKQKYQLMSWLNNPKKGDSFVIIKKSSLTYTLSSIDNHYRFSLNDDFASDDTEFAYDTVVFDTRTQSFVMYSSLLNAPSFELISISK